MENKIYVAIRSEDKSFWEKRTPLPPHDCQYIMKKHPNIQFIVQPSSKRIFTDDEYRDVGCLVQEDISLCELIVCIKEIPLDKYMEGKTYLHWSHTIKAQSQNMAALDKMLEMKVRHIDYEKIYVDGKNITAFPFAGIAGVISFMSEYGKLLLQKNINSPFLTIGPAYQYFDKKAAYRGMNEAGELIKKRGLPKEVDLPLIIGVLGSNGLCGKGSMEALSNLPITIIKPDQAKILCQNKNDPAHKYTIYVIPFVTTDLVRYSEDYDKEFTSKDYYEHPHLYTPVFHSKYLPYLNIIINDIYWENKFPRYITNHQMRDLVQAGQSRLQAICDVTCDLEGSIQFLKKYTTPSDPIYFYDPITEEIVDKFETKRPNNLLYMSIDFLPSQLPYDASLAFGETIRDIIPEIAFSDSKKPLAESGLPKYLQDATITLHGQLTDKFKYITHLRNMNEKLKENQNFQPKKALKKVPSYFAIKLEGHLFDTGAINKVFDQLQGHIKFNVVDIQVGQDEHHESHVVIQLFSKENRELMDKVEKVNTLCETLNIKVSVE